MALAEKRRQLKNGFPENIAKELAVLNKNFADLCEDFELQTDKEKEEKRGWFWHAQLIYFKLGESYVMHLFNTDGEKMETSSILEVPTEQNQTEETKSVLMYRDYQRWVMPLIELGQLNMVNESAINEILNAVNGALEHAKQLNIGLQEGENAIMAIVYSKLDAVSKGIWNFQLSLKNPTLDDLVNFLVKRAAMLKAEQMDVASTSTTSMRYHVDSQKPTGAIPRAKYCLYCDQTSHNIFHCTYFDGLVIHAKERFLREEGRCFNCFQ